jgi:type II secretory pathway component PulJ
MTPAARPRRRGFTVLEMMIACGLTAFLGILLVTACSAYQKAAAEVIARCRIAEEADLAIHALSADLGASLSSAITGPKERGLPTAVFVASDGSRLAITFEDSAAPENSRVVIYEIRSDLTDLAQLQRQIQRQKLVRWVESLSPQAVVEAERVVAWDVKALASAAIPGGWREFRLTFELSFPEKGPDGTRLERTYSLLAMSP